MFSKILKNLKDLDTRVESTYKMSLNKKNMKNI